MPPVLPTRVPPPRALRRTVRTALLAIVTAMAVAACASQQNKRGNIPDETNLAELQIGTHTRADVGAILGTPSARGTFSDNIWYYIGRETSRIAFLDKKVLDQQVVAIEFDDNGFVSTVRRYSQQDGQQVQMVDRTTPTTGKELSFIEQLFGNLGKFNKAPGGGG